MATPKFIPNPGGPVLGTAGVPILEVDGLKFKDMERTGTLLPYEDWRLTPEERAADLAKRLTVEEIAGLMMYSNHQMVPFRANSFMPFKATYDGKKFEESGADPWALTDQQKKFLSEDHLRYVLAITFDNGDVAARWNNEMQAFCEALPHGIPVNTSSDPRHGAGNAAAEFKTEASDVSKWPEGLAMAATFDPEICKQFGRVMAREYRALGISTALSPQIDLGTEPRWMRIEDTYGASPALVTDMARAYCDGLQTDPDSESGWGMGSVTAMAKHWPGGGPCEGGRDAHYPFGKYAVYPGKNFETHLKPFLEGAFKLDGPTGKAAAVMPYYTVSTGVDPSGELVGNSFNRYIINDLLRKKYGYDGVICTDWGITHDPTDTMDHISTCHGMEESSEVERHFRILENGVDQFGGNNDMKPILGAYEKMVEAHGEAAARARFEESAVRLLLGSFRCGLFENPYLDPAESKAVLGCKEFCAAGFEAQLKSVVMVKNNGALPIKGRKKMYIPGRTIGERKAFFRFMVPAQQLPGADRAAAERFYDWAETPEEADFALCFIESPISDGWRLETGYRPVTLQYRPYTAEEAREHSLAGGDPRERENPDRGYKGKSNTAANEADLDLVLDTRKAMGDKPVIVCVRMHNPCVLAELEGAADAILVDFGVQQDAIMTLVSGQAQPGGLLPVALPADMAAVEKHCEDVPFDYAVYTDSVGNTYDFGFGLDWAGVICDERTERYKR